jgi:hypothetical protein
MRTALRATPRSLGREVQDAEPGDFAVVVGAALEWRQSSRIGTHPASREARPGGSHDLRAGQRGRSHLCATD